MRIGFTGTQKGVTIYQKTNLIIALSNNKIENFHRVEFHHGDCIGADEEACGIAIQCGFFIIVHPPINERKRAFTEYDIMLPAKGYIARNHDIVNDTDILYACPDGPEKVRSGTWATIRYALKKKKKVVIFHHEESNVSQHSSPNIIDNT